MVDLRCFYTNSCVCRYREVLGLSMLIRERGSWRTKSADMASPQQVNELSILEVFLMKNLLSYDYYPLTARSSKRKENTFGLVGF